MGEEKGDGGVVGKIPHWASGRQWGFTWRGSYDCSKGRIWEQLPGTFQVFTQTMWVTERQRRGEEFQGRACGTRQLYDMGGHQSLAG